MFDMLSILLLTAGLLMPDYTPIEQDWLRVIAGFGFRSPTVREDLMGKWPSLTVGLLTLTPVYEHHPTKYSQSNPSQVFR